MCICKRIKGARFQKRPTPWQTPWQTGKASASNAHRQRSPARARSSAAAGIYRSGEAGDRPPRGEAQTPPSPITPKARTRAVSHHPCAGLAREPRHTDPLLSSPPGAVTRDTRERPQVTRAGGGCSALPPRPPPRRGPEFTERGPGGGGGPETQPAPPPASPPRFWFRSVLASSVIPARGHRPPERPVGHPPPRPLPRPPHAQPLSDPLSPEGAARPFLQRLCLNGREVARSAALRGPADTAAPRHPPPRPDAWHNLPAEGRLRGEPRHPPLPPLPPGVRSPRLRDL